MFSKNRKIVTALLWVCLALAVSLQIHNLLSFPIQRGFDAGAHLEYIAFLKKYMKIPLPYEGWELYQPPLYYLLVTPFATPLGIKICGLVTWLLLGLGMYFFIRRLYNNTNMALVGTIAVVTLPVVLYLSFAVSNEFFSGVLIGMTLIFYTCFYNTTKWKSHVILGVLLGVSFLAKATGFVLLVSIFLDQVIKLKYNGKKLIMVLGVPYGIAFLISGWYYVRNVILFHGPFISSYDFPKLFPLHQTVIPRTFSFFFTLKGFSTLDLFRSHHYSFLSGTYYSWFYDAHNIIIPVQEFSKIGEILIVLSLPIFVFFLIGFIKEFFAKKDGRPVLLIYTIFLYIGYIAYNFRLPFYSTVKGAFLVSSVVPFGYFVLRGLHPYRRYIIFIALFLLIYTLVILKNFWIMPSWYPTMIRL